MRIKQNALSCTETGCKPLGSETTAAPLFRAINTAVGERRSKMVKAINDLTGKRFGKLTVIKQAEHEGRHSYWLCSCDCGAKKVIRGTSLTSGKQISCGCVRHERLALGNKALTKHGGTNTRLYHVWRGMIDRTERKGNRSYKNYGARGIKICKEWRENFDTFREWAIKNGYDETAKFGDCTIDRIDVDGNYEPNNCRWADAKTQALNTRRRKYAKS